MKRAVGTIPVLAVAALSGLLVVNAATGRDAPQLSPAGAGAAGEIHKLPPGYLPRAALPDSLALLPPPPSPGSASMQRDEEARQSVLGLRGSPRYALATKDAVIGFPDLANDFSCAAGVPIGKDSTPRLYRLMGKMMIDVGLSTYRAKDRFKRVRPFVAHDSSSCYPKDEAVLRNDGSYPSGHSALGWGYALVLAELIPSRADAILQRGRDFGQSRLVCDVHWQSDIDAGRVIAAAAVARLHGDPVFRADMDAARAEAARAARPAGNQCAAEAAALAPPD